MNSIKTLQMSTLVDIDSGTEDPLRITAEDMDSTACEHLDPSQITVKEESDSPLYEEQGPLQVLIKEEIDPNMYVLEDPLQTSAKDMVSITKQEPVVTSTVSNSEESVEDALPSEAAIAEPRVDTETEKEEGHCETVEQDLNAEDPSSSNNDESKLETSPSIHSCSARSDSFKFTCPSCVLGFSSLDKLQEHRELCIDFDPTQPVKKRKKWQPFKGEKNFMCEQCASMYKNKNGLKHHMRKHAGTKSFVCDLCESRFDQRRNLTLHIKSHSGIKGFICDLCQSSFRHKVTLVRHRKTHTTTIIKPHSCNVCNATFTQRAYLTKHMLTHTNMKSYACELCDSCFKRSDGLKVHMRKHTGVKPFTCDVCDRGFTQKICLLAHMPTHTRKKP